MKRVGVWCGAQGGCGFASVDGGVGRGVDCEEREGGSACVCHTLSITSSHPNQLKVRWAQWHAGSNSTRS